MKKTFFSMMIFVVAFSQMAHASAPQVKKTAPGFYRFMIGDIEVTSLLDGTFPMKVTDKLTNVRPKEVTKLLGQAHEGEAVVFSDIGYLVNTGTKLVLIDTGAAGGMGPTTGKLMENLRASGYQPEQVDEVYITHMHADHIGGLAIDGKKAFPQAVLRADQHEADFWLSAEEAGKNTNPQMKSMFATATANFGLYKNDGKFKPFNGDTELVPGVFAHAAYGHTPGHTVYSVESKGKKLWLVGDMIHVGAVQFPQPTATMAFDWNSKLASAERIKDFNVAAKGGDVVGAAHLSFPGVGRLRKEGNGFVFAPITYGSMTE